MLSLLAVMLHINVYKFRAQVYDCRYNLSSHTDLQTHAGSALDNPVTLTVDLLTPGSMRLRAKGLS